MSLQLKINSLLLPSNLSPVGSGPRAHPLPLPPRSLQSGVCPHRVITRDISQGGVAVNLPLGIKLVEPQWMCSGYPKRLMVIMDYRVLSIQNSNPGDLSVNVGDISVI